MLSAAPASESELPDAFDAATSADTLATRAAWWSTFNDPTLDALVDSALVRNLDIRAAVARVTELQNQYRIARAPLMPAIQGSVDGAQLSVPSNTGSFGSIGNTIPGFPDRFENVTYSASLGFSYELDFWGRNRNAAGAALNDYFATRAAPSRPVRPCGRTGSMSASSPKLRVASFPHQLSSASPPCRTNTARILKRVPC